MANTSSTPSLHYDQSNYWWGKLVNLLKDLEKPTANDHLVLNTIKHPDLFQFINQSFYFWVLNFVLHTNGKGAMQAAVTQMNAMGMKDNEISDFFLLNVGYSHRGAFNIEG